MKALDLFCGAGGASMGLHLAGFEVTGVDRFDQPNYPFKFIKADARIVNLEGYDFIWASPPCQAYTNAHRLWNFKHPDYIDEIRQRIHHLPYTIENVPQAPLKDKVILCGSMFGLDVYRHRAFECNFPVIGIPECNHSRPMTKMGRKPKEGEIIQVVGHFSGIEYAKKAMGIDWMLRDEIKEAIPPAFSKFIAEQFLRTLQ